MAHIIIFSIIALAIFIITFIKLIKENNSNYIFTLIPEFIGLLLDFIFILNGISPNIATFILLYILNVFIPIVLMILEKNNINIIEITRILKSKIYLNKNQKDLSKKMLIKNISENPNSYLSHKALAEWYKENNEYEKAETEYAKTIELKPKNYDNYLKLATIYKVNEKNELAVNVLQELLRKKPEYTDASLMLGDILYSNDMFKEAIAVYQEALKYNPKEYNLYYCMGMTYTRLNDFKNAKEYYKKAAEINSYLSVANLNLGQISLIFKDYDESEKYFMKCIESDDEKVAAEAYYYLAKLKLINNQKEIAIQYANIAIELDPSILKVMENDEYFSIIIGKIKIKESKEAETKISEKENELILYLNKTYGVVEKLIENDISKENINKEREI